MAPSHGSHIRSHLSAQDGGRRVEKTGLHMYNGVLLTITENKDGLAMCDNIELEGVMLREISPRQTNTM